MSNIFERIVDTTAAMASVDKTSIPSSKGKWKRWTNLSYFWSSKPEIFDDVFYKAIAHIATGRYPKNSSNLKPLLTLVEEAILFNGEALRAWRRCKAFREAFRCVTGMIRRRNRHCSEIRQFVIDRLHCLTFYRDEFRNEIDYSISSNREVKRAKAMDCVRRRYANFTTFIHTFIPESENWSADQLTSEKRIFSAFKAVHGVDYANNLDDFSILFDMMNVKFNGRPYHMHLFRIKDLEPSMVEAIWPENIVKELSKQLIHASNKMPVIIDGEYRPDIDSVAPAVVNSSWAYRMLASCGEKRKFTKAVRDSLLYFGWGDHPRIVKEKQRAAAAALQSA